MFLFSSADMFLSRKFSPDETRYSTYDRELTALYLAVMFTLTINSRYSLFGSCCTRRQFENPGNSTLYRRFGLLGRGANVTVGCLLRTASSANAPQSSETTRVYYSAESHPVNGVNICRWTPFLLTEGNRYCVVNKFTR
ncbi:unnamed protein product [Ceratitis capitata]|uniref:(Mediterranean fruit fly) hypothetical protein n=1 Tax=Ceratitis capitata TaxID=7213 RepID=A0A811UDS7_CERCA|nr:unnamed protein product [Ceratitis capitata]